MTDCWRIMSFVPFGSFVQHAATVVTAGLLAAFPAHAQQPPDAGALRQQLERERWPAVVPAQPPVAPPLHEPAAPDETPDGVTLRGFRFQGNRLLDDRRLATALEPFKGKSLGLPGLRQAAATVAGVYREAGWLVRTYLPPQDVSKGYLTIAIVEATFGGVEIEGTAPQRLGGERLRRHLQGRLVLGEPIRSAEVDRALLLGTELSGVSVSGALRAGARDGETVLTASVQDQPLVSGSVALDNTGSRSTGAQRASLGLSLASPAHLGDQLDFSVMHTQGSRNGQLAYLLPLSPSGLRLGLSVSAMHYRVVAPELRSLGSLGRSSTVGMDLRYPWVRSRAWNLYGVVSAEWKAFLNEANAAVQSRYGVMTGSAGGALDWIDGLGGGARSTVNLTWVQGRSHRQSGDPGSNPLLDSRFDKVRWNLTRQQVLPVEALSLALSVSGQHSDETLDSSEKFSLGGASGVRAYPSGEGSGAAGWLGSVELRWQPRPAWALSVFADQGHVRNFDGTPSHGLKGWGLAGQWTAEPGWRVRMVWARRQGSNPNPSSTGTDQDGSLVRNRWWMLASKGF